MAPLPPESTARYKMFYTTVGHQHTMEMRAGLLSPAAAGVEFANFLQPLSTAGILNSLTVDEVQFAADNSPIFNSVTTGIEGISYGSGAGSVAQVPNYYDFVGRSADGRRVRVAVFGATYVGGDYRIIAGENPGVDGSVVALNSNANAWWTIGGLPAVWKGYANAGYNAYWQRAVRP